MERLQPASVLATVKGVYDDISGEMLSAASERRMPGISEMIEKIVARLQIVEKENPLFVLDGRGILLKETDYSFASPVVENMLLAIDDTLSLKARAAEEQIARLAGSEDAILFSDPLHAKLAVIHAFGTPQHILIARRDLYEDRSGLRLENIFRLLASRWKETGAGNRVLPEDYITRMSDKTGLIWFSITENLLPSLDKNGLKVVRESMGLRWIPCIADIDLVPLTDLSSCMIDHVPPLGDYVRSGYDLVLCGGGQLIGGPNCGILVGSKRAIEVIRISRMAALFAPHRVDLAGLQRTLDLYSDPDIAFSNIPVLQRITTSVENLENRAERLIPQLSACSLIDQVRFEKGESVLRDEPCSGRVPSIVLHITPKEKTAEQFASFLESRNPALKVRFQEKEILIDLRSISPMYDGNLAEIFESCSNTSEPGPQEEKIIS